MTQRHTDLVYGFRQAAPYLNQHRGQAIVCHLDTKTLDSADLNNILSDMVVLHGLGVRFILVFGAGQQIDAALAAQGKKSRYHKGVRIADKDTLTTLMQVCGALQQDISAKLSMAMNNTPMEGTALTVLSGNFVMAKPLGVDEGVDFCHSGTVRRINEQSIHQSLLSGAMIVIGPMAGSITGESFALNSEEIATQLAIKLNAHKLIAFCHDKGLVDEQGRVISELLPNEAEALAKSMLTSTLKGPTHSAALAKAQQTHVSFLQSAAMACRHGVPRCHLISSQINGALIQELFSLDGIGTQVVTENAEQLRLATIDDIGGIIDLISPLEEQSILVKRSREQLEQDIPRFSVIVKDDKVIGCAALYLYPTEQMAEMACLAIDPHYRDQDRAQQLLNQLIAYALAEKITQLFALTTYSLHWFKEQGFVDISIDNLPIQRQKNYNAERGSKVLALDLKSHRLKRNSQTSNSARFIAPRVQF